MNISEVLPNIGIKVTIILNTLVEWRRWWSCRREITFMSTSHKVVPGNDPWREMIGDAERNMDQSELIK